jgi:ketosteroid isomerase-like protein
MQIHIRQISRSIVRHEMKTRWGWVFLIAYSAMASDVNNRELWIEEVAATEAAFAAMAEEKGLKEAFLAYADENAVLNRGNRLYQGREQIAAYFDAQKIEEVSLVWTPEFIDVSDDGTLAYTYGPFTLSGKSAEGEAIKAQGIFHTVWKRQPDGDWKYVYD